MKAFCRMKNILVKTFLSLFIYTALYAMEHTGERQLYSHERDPVHTIGFIDSFLKGSLQPLVDSNFKITNLEFYNVFSKTYESITWDSAVQLVEHAQKNGHLFLDAVFSHITSDEVDYDDPSVDFLYTVQLVRLKLFLDTKSFDRSDVPNLCHELRLLTPGSLERVFGTQDIISIAFNIIETMNARIGYIESLKKSDGLLCNWYRRSSISFESENLDNYIQAIKHRYQDLSGQKE